MPGDIRFVISGDASSYEKELNRINVMVEEIKQRVDALTKEIRQEDVATDTMVKETVDKTKIELSNVRASINIESGELDKLEIKRQEAENRVKFTVSGALLGLRAITDIAALVSVTTGERIDVQFLTMISMGLSAAMQVQTQAAIYAATPGMQPMAMMMLALIPTITGMIGMLKAEQMKYNQRIDTMNTKQVDSILDGFTYGD